MNKYLRITMPDGSKWDVPARIIAENRARYYARIDYELTDWAANNMDWDDVKEYAVRSPIEPEEPDYQEGWINGEKEIVEW